jgi:hypothetical protein
VATPFGSAPAIITGVAVGAAAGAALAPAVEVDRQEAWLKITAAVREPGLLAQLVAAGGIDLKAAQAEANRSGLSSSKFDALVWLEQAAPGTAELLELWRRGKIDEPLVDLGLAKAKLDARYWPAVKELEHARLNPPTIALAVQRGILENVKNPNGSDRLLTVTPDLSAVTIDSPAQVDLDVLAEAFGHGYTFERLAVDARLAGIPPAPGELMQLLNRGEINEADFLLGIAEGDTRNEWAGVLRELRFRLLSGVELSELVIRGWLEQPKAAQLAGLDGWTAERFDLLVKLRGRPLVEHQVTTGLARGGKFGDDYDTVPEPFRTSIRQSNIRPEWAGIAYANRYTYSVPFWWRALATAGAFGAIDPKQLLLNLGNPPAFAEAVVAHYVGSSSKASDPHVSKAQTQLWTATHDAYRDFDVDDAGATVALELAGVEPAAVPTVLELWQAERELVRHTLTPAQLRKAVAAGRRTSAEALERLQQLGYSEADALELLAE